MAAFPFRLWTSTQRRITPRQPASPPPSASTRTPSPTIKAPTDRQPTTITTTPASTSAASFKTPPTSEPENQDPSPLTITNEPTTPPSIEVQTAIHPTNNATPSNLVDEPQTSSLSRSTSQSRALFQPSSPSRRTSQSRSPPLPSSPSRVSPKTRSPTSSPPPVTSQTPSTPQKKSLHRSPSCSISRSPKLAPSPSVKRVQPTSPSKELKRSIPKSNAASIIPKEEEPKPAASQHEPIEQQQKAEIKNDDANNFINLTTNETNIKHKEEIREDLNTAIEETKKEIRGFRTPKYGSEAHITKNLNTAIDSDPMHVEKQEMKQGVNLESNNQSAQPRGENVSSYQEIREDKMTIGDPKSGNHEKPVSVITLAGENRGASMHLGSDSSRTERPIHIQRSYKSDPNANSDTTTDLESNSKDATKMENPRTLEDQPASAYVNNNSQSINNSLVFNCSISERNPGVHMVLANVPKESIESREKTKVSNIRKAEFSKTTAEKVMYEPKIRRRCLQGLFLEPSDSETEDLEKPRRRHGCRVGCKIRGKDDEVDVL